MEAVGWRSGAACELDARYAPDLRRFAALLQEYEDDDLRIGGLEEDIANIRNQRRTVS